MPFLMCNQEIVKISQKSSEVLILQACNLYQTTL